jgi:hypothetical protein
MKTMLKISMVLNLGLVAGLLVLMQAGHKRLAAAAATVVPVRTTSNEAVNVNSVPPAQAEPKPFRWSELEAKDYHLYVKNLRGIGCPEFTLRIIVTADVEAAYQGRIAALERKIAAFEGSSWTNQLAAPGTTEALKSELRQIPGEEIAEINDLLGLKPTPSQIAVADAAPMQGRHPLMSSGTPPAMPYVFADLDLTALNLNPDQQKMFAEMRQDFVDRIGGTNQDPNDPAYLERWQKAQAYEDSMLSAWLGSDVVSKIEDLEYPAGSQGMQGQ